MWRGVKGVGRRGFAGSKGRPCLQRVVSAAPKARQSVGVPHALPPLQRQRQLRTSRGHKHCSLVPPLRNARRDLTVRVWDLYSHEGGCEGKRGWELEGEGERDGGGEVKEAFRICWRGDGSIWPRRVRRKRWRR